MASGWMFTFRTLLSVTVEEVIPLPADDNSSRLYILRRIASQKDLFDSQGVNEGVNGDPNEEGEQGQEAEDDMEAIVNAGRQANDYNTVTKSQLIGRRVRWPV